MHWRRIIETRKLVQSLFWFMDEYESDMNMNQIWIYLTKAHIRVPLDMGLDQIYSLIRSGVGISAIWEKYWKVLKGNLWKLFACCNCFVLCHEHLRKRPAFLIWVRYYIKYFTYIFSLILTTFPQSHFRFMDEDPEVRNIVKKKLSQGYTANKWQIWHLTTESWIPEPWCMRHWPYDDSVFIISLFLWFLDRNNFVHPTQGRHLAVSLDGFVASAGVEVATSI